MVIRKGTPDVDVAGWVEDVVQQYLYRTENEGYWSEAYYQWRSQIEDLEAFSKEHGDPAKGYHWGRVFLPNGTRIMMQYKDSPYYAEVKHEDIHYEGHTYSPSELASVIANNTRRNAWRDLLIKRPKDDEWVLADILRRRNEKVSK